MAPDTLKLLEKLTLDEKIAAIDFLTHALRQRQDWLTQRQALLRLMNDVVPLPVHNPHDGFSGRDHDKALYGEAS